MSNIVLKDKSNTPKTYTGIERISVVNSSGQPELFFSQKKVDEAVREALENAPQPALYKKTIYENGTYTPESPYIGFSEIIVNVPTSGGGGTEDDEGGGTQPDVIIQPVEFELELRYGEWFSISPASTFKISASPENIVSITPFEGNNDYFLVAQELGSTQLTVSDANGNNYAKMNITVVTDNFVALLWAEDTIV